MPTVCARPMLWWTPFLACLLASIACAGGEPPVTQPVLPTWTFDPAMTFPADGSLARPEDGVALPGGRLLVADQVHGLRLVQPDGRSEPFGEMLAAGYRHQPPEFAGGANGVSLEPDGAHALVADIFGGALFRVNVTTGAAQKLYQHAYGINAAVRDARGTIWFTQSARNRPEDGEGRMWATVESPVAEGALLRLRMQGDRPAGPAEVVVDSLYFANGVVVDDAAGRLYLSEIVAGRIWRFRMDAATGRLSDRELFADSVAADNLELDADGNLWLPLPLENTVLIVNTATKARHIAFREQSAAQVEAAAEFLRRGERGEPRLELFTPELWAPLPGLVTGVILPHGRARGPVYLTTLTNALIRLP